MKRLTTLFYTILVAGISAMASCPFVPTDTERRVCYHEDPQSHDITFIFDPQVWGYDYSDISALYLWGSFNMWGSQRDEQMRLQPDAEQQLYYLTLPYNRAKAPYNMGQPEYRFILNGMSLAPYEGFPEEYTNNFNGRIDHIVVFSWQDLTEVRKTIDQSTVYRMLDEFDLTTREGQEEISNFRTVPGTTALHRCYHPFKSTTRDYMATEPVRLHYITELAIAENVKANICLNGNHTSRLETFYDGDIAYQEEIPPYYQEIIDAGHVLYVGEGYRTPGYSDAYYMSDSKDFAYWVNEIVNFILDPEIEGDFSINCQLGIDRTGMFSAVLAAFCDASWEEIIADYDKSNRMGIDDYRHPNLLRYSFENMLGVTSIEEVAPRFAEAVQDNLIERGAVTREQITALKHRLQSHTTVLDLSMVKNTNDIPIYYNLQGQRVLNPDSGLYIVIRNGRSTLTYGHP